MPLLSKRVVVELVVELVIVAVAIAVAAAIAVHHPRVVSLWRAFCQMPHSSTACVLCWETLSTNPCSNQLFAFLSSAISPSSQVKPTAPHLQVAVTMEVSLLSRSRSMNQ